MILLSAPVGLCGTHPGLADPLRAPESGQKTTAQQSRVHLRGQQPLHDGLWRGWSADSEAKQKASALVEAFSETDKFHVFTSAFDGRDQRFVTQSEALERIAAIQLSSHAPKLESVVQRGLDQFQHADGATPRGFGSPICKKAATTSVG